MTERPGHDPATEGAGWRAPDAFPEVDYGHLNGWDRDFESFSDFDLPSYVGPSTFSNLPWVTDPAEIARREVDVAIVGAPFDDAVSHRPGARFGPRAIREANYSTGSINSLQLGHVEPFEVLTVVDAGDARRRPRRPELTPAAIWPAPRFRPAGTRVPAISRAARPRWASRRVSRCPPSSGAPTRSVARRRRA